MSAGRCLARSSRGSCFCESVNMSGGPEELSSWNKAWEPSRNSGSDIGTTSTSDVCANGCPNLWAEGLKPRRALPTIQTSCEPIPNSDATCSSKMGLLMETCGVPSRRETLARRSRASTSRVSVRIGPRAWKYAPVSRHLRLAYESSTRLPQTSTRTHHRTHQRNARTISHDA